MGMISRATTTPDYSMMTINEFILMKYKMGHPLEPMVWQVSIPIMGIQMFIIQKEKNYRGF
jgi:hypothetical protein